MALPTAADAERAFYRAFEQGDVEDMMALWSPVGSVLCVHPMGPALTDLDMIRASWLEIFASPISHRIDTTLLMENRANDVVVRVVMENFTIPNREETFPPVFATNTFWRGDSGWYIASHHASPGKIDERSDSNQPATKH